MNKSLEITQNMQCEIVGAYASTAKEQQNFKSHEIIWRHPVFKFDNIEDPYRITDTLYRKVGEVATLAPFPGDYVEFPFKESLPISNEALCPIVCIVGGEFSEGAKRESIIDIISQKAVKEFTPVPIKPQDRIYSSPKKDRRTKPTMRPFAVDLSDYFGIRQEIKSALIDDLFLDIYAGGDGERFMETLLNSGTISAKEYDSLNYFMARQSKDAQRLKILAEKSFRDIDETIAINAFENFKAKYFGQ